MSLFPINSYATGATVPSPAPLAPSAPAPRPAVNALPNAAPVAAQQDVKSTTAQDVKLDKAVDAINDFLKPVASSLEFSVDKDSGRTVVQVIDTDTNDIIRQFPSKEALAISRELDKFQGLLLRDKA